MLLGLPGWAQIAKSRADPRLSSWGKEEVERGWEEKRK